MSLATDHKRGYISAIFPPFWNTDTFIVFGFFVLYSVTRFPQYQVNKTKQHTHTHTCLNTRHFHWLFFVKNSREKWRKCISVTGNLRGQAQVRPTDKLDEACTNVDDQMNGVHSPEEAPRSFTMAPCVAVERLEAKQRCSRAAVSKHAGIQARK